MSISKDAEKIMNERFGKDNVISLATCIDNMPAVRYVNAYYDNRAFYVLTYALSNKINHIEINPNVAIIPPVTPPELNPAYVDIFTPIGPGVDSDTAIMSASML